MVRQLRAQSVRAFTPMPAVVQFGTQVFALVGTKSKAALRKLVRHAQDDRLSRGGRALCAALGRCAYESPSALLPDY
jgi:hypothetical protein